MGGVAVVWSALLDDELQKCVRSRHAGPSTFVESFVPEAPKSEKSCRTFTFIAFKITTFSLRSLPLRSVSFFRQVDLTHSLQTLVRITTALARAAVQQRRGVGARGTHIAISHLLRSAFTHHENMARPHRGDLTTDGRA